MSTAAVVPEAYGRVQRLALIAGAAGLALGALGWLTSPVEFFRSYLTAYTFWMGMALGSLPLILLHHLVGGHWGSMLRRPLEAAAQTMPLMALLFVPIALGMGQIYPWLDPEVAKNPVVAHKAAYLNTSFFLGRTAFYFVFWSALAFSLARGSAAQDRTDDPGPERRLGALSGPAMVLFVLTASFAAIDWLMSLEPDWYSTIYGPMWAVGQVLTAFAGMVLVSTLLLPNAERPDQGTPNQLNDLGNLLLAFVMLWTYMSFSQFLITWMGNLKEEIPWYLRRVRGGWAYVAILMVVFQFAVPFVALLFRDAKRRADSLRLIAAAVLGMHLVSTFWLVKPAFPGPRIDLHWIDLPAVVGIGGVWLAAFLWLLRRRPLVPVHAPRPAGEVHVGVA